MREVYNYMDYKSRDAAENIRIEFDESAWDKMEALLNAEAMKPYTQTISNPAVINKDKSKSRKWLLLVAALLLAVTVLVFTKDYFISKNETLASIKNDGKALGKSTGEDLI